MCKPYGIIGILVPTVSPLTCPAECMSDTIHFCSIDYNLGMDGSFSSLILLRLSVLRVRLGGLSPR